MSNDEKNVFFGAAVGFLGGLVIVILISESASVPNRKVMSSKPFELKDKIYRCIKVKLWQRVK